MPKLFKNEEPDLEEELNINTDYAKNYDSWRQKEELHKLKARYGEDVEDLAKSEEESSESSDDDEAEEIPEEFEKCFYKTLACLKNKDPRIYKEDEKFFTEKAQKEIDNRTVSKEKKEKSLFLRDYERKIIVERDGKFSDSENEKEAEYSKPQNHTYVQEQQELKDSFKKVLQDEESEDDLLLKPKSKTNEEAQKDEEDFKKWLKGQKNEINDEKKKELKPLRDFWTDPNLDKDEKFLRDYILNKKFLDKESADANFDELSYDHQAHDSDENLSEDERNIDQQEEFEHKYNFRFEEPDQEFIKRYPRTLENSLRKKDTRRAQKRVEIKARKEEEKLKKKEELKQLKALKRKEIEEKIEKLKEITGNDDLQLNMLDLEGDFNPEEYDKKMSQIFNDHYYAEEEGDMKPEFPDIDEELQIESNWDSYDPANEEIAQQEIPYHDVPHCEDSNFNMDADYDGQKGLKSESDESTKKRNRRRRSKFAEMIAQEKPKFDPSQHPSYKEYYDQYYALDYEDMIGDLPCRFKYRQVVPNDYGLSVEEILTADDKELNKWCSLKKALEYKPDHKELNDVKMYKQKASNEALKRKILKSLYSTSQEESESPEIATPQNIDTSGKKKRKRRKKNQLVNEMETNIEKKSVSHDQPETEINQSLKNNTKTAQTSKVKKHENNIEAKNQVSKKKTSLLNKIEYITEKKRKIEQSIEESSDTEKREKKKRKKDKKARQDTETNDNHINTNDTNKIHEESSHSAQKKPTDDVLPTQNTQNGSILKQNARKNKNKKNKLENKNDIPMSKKEERKQRFKKIQKKKIKSENVDQIASLSEERLKAYGLNPKKFKNKLKYMKKR